MSIDPPTLDEACQRAGKNDKTFPYIDLSGKRIGDEGAIRFAEALKGNTHVNIIFLPCNGIGPRGAKALADALVGLQQMEEVYIAQNRIGDEGAKAFARYIENASRTLNVLDLSANKITAEGAAALHQAKHHLGKLALIGNPCQHDKVAGAQFVPETQGTMIYSLCCEKTKQLVEKEN